MGGIPQGGLPNAQKEFGYKQIKSLGHLDLEHLEIVSARPGATCSMQTISTMPVLRRHAINSLLPTQVWARDFDIRY